jgi:hypothetical protein
MHDPNDGTFDCHAIDFIPDEYEEWLSAVEDVILFPRRPGLNVRGVGALSAGGVPSRHPCPTDSFELDVLERVSSRMRSPHFSAS